MTNGFYLKNEASISLKNGSLGDYLGAGVRQKTKYGTFEEFFAIKSNQTSQGGFGEFKYTSPYLGDVALESRTRVQLESGGNSVTTRLAGKYSTNLDKWNIYEIAGTTAKVPINSDNSTSISPVSLTGIGYNVKDNLCVYGEYEVSKGYNLEKKEWGEVSSAVNLGIKYTF